MQLGTLRNWAAVRSIALYQLARISFEDHTELQLTVLEANSPRKGCLMLLTIE